MPNSLRYLTAFASIVAGLVPLLVAPGLAESYGWDRSTGSDVGALITIVWFVLAGWISRRIIRGQERRRLEREFGPILAQYSNYVRKGGDE